MFPDFAAKYLPDKRHADAKTLSNDSRNYIMCQYANLNYIAFDQLSTRVSLTDHSGLPAFLFAIVHVVFVRAKKEVCRIDTAGIVAFMKAIKTSRDCAVMKLIRKTMGQSRLVLHFECAIALAVGSCRPLPAFVGAALANFGPESFLRRSSLNSHLAAMTGQEAHGVAFAVTASFRSHFSDWSGITAAAFAEFYRGLVRGMIVHVNSPFMTLTTPPDGSNRRGGNFIDCYSFNYTTGAS